MAEKTIYAGPGKVYTNSVALQPEGENGPINLALIEDTNEIAASMFGRIGEQVADQVVDLTLKPFDSWGNLRTLFPVYLGVSVGASAGVLAIGTRPHTAANLSTKIWTPDGRLYNIVRSALIGHPTLHLGIGKALFGDVKILGVGDGVTPVAMGASGFLIAGNAITESAASDPGGNFTMADFIRGAWTGVWGAVTGFDAIEAEDEWTIETAVKYSPLKVQGRTRGLKLDSVGFMAKCRPFGPTQTQILANIGAHTHGQRLGSADLTLTGPSSKTITLKNAEIKGGGFQFGGTQLGTGEIGFVNEMTFSAGAPQPLLIFSA
jgi:hypothetical protein